MENNIHEHEELTDDEVSRNAFEALCGLIKSEAWCTNQYCGTCGHGLFRLGLKNLAEGMHPDMPDWKVTKDDAVLMRGTDSLFPPLLTKFSEQEQKALTEIINAVDLEKISKLCDLRQILTFAFG